MPRNGIKVGMSFSAITMPVYSGWLKALGTILKSRVTVARMTIGDSTDMYDKSPPLVKLMIMIILDF